MVLLNIHHFIAATCLPSFFFRQKKLYRKLTMKMENSSHNLSSLIDPKLMSLVVKVKDDQATSFLKTMKVVKSQGSCFIPGTSPASEEIGLKNLWILCGHWCCVNHHHALVHCLCFSIVCVKGRKISPFYMLSVHWLPWVLMERYSIFSSVFQNIFQFTHLFTYTTMNSETKNSQLCAPTNSQLAYEFM